MHEISVIVASEADSGAICRAYPGADRIQAEGAWWIVPIQPPLVSSELRMPDLEESAEANGLSTVLAPLIASLARIPLQRPIALAFTQYFGGAGAQAAAVLESTKLVFGPLVSEDAINEALARVGVRASLGRDAFDTVGLSRWRSMDAFMHDAG